MAFDGAASKARYTGVCLRKAHSVQGLIACTLYAFSREVNATAAVPRNPKPELTSDVIAWTRRQLAQNTANPRVSEFL